MTSQAILNEKIWFDKPKYDAAERRYYERLAKSSETAKVVNSAIVTDQQENADLIEVQDVPASLNNSCSLSDKKSPKKVHHDKKSNKNQDSMNKEAKNETCSTHNGTKIKEEEKPCCVTKHDLSNLNLKEGSFCTMTLRSAKIPEKDTLTKQVELLLDSSQQPAPKSANKANGNESSCSPQTIKVEKTEKHKKSDVQSKDNNMSKGECTANIKVETGDITCSKAKGQNKTKFADDKSFKQEFVPDKGSFIDPVSDVVKIDDIAVTSNTVSVEVTNRLNSLEKENLDLKNQVSELTELLKKMDLRISSLEKTNAGGSKSSDVKAPAPVPHPKKDDAEDDDGVDLFGSDSEEEDTEAAKIKEQRLAEYAARKAKKPVLIAKSNIILDVKPWDDETNMKELEAEVRKITTDGLVWGASKLVPLAYGIHKLQISCVVEDDKVSVDWLQETIQEIEEYVQSVDIAAFNKV